jgi:hypothetical protein
MDKNCIFSTAAFGYISVSFSADINLMTVFPSRSFELILILEEINSPIGQFGNYWYTEGEKRYKISRVISVRHKM